MSEWGWVAFAYSVAYAAILSYIGWLAWRVRNARRRLEEVR